MVAGFAAERIRQAFQEVYMNSAEVLDVGREAIWLTVQLCAPCLIVGLLVGVGIGLLQALTQVQEATLVYAPKIVAIFVSLLVFLPLMGALLSGFMHHIAARIASL
jgi:flagellar biosynthetic protein FliQ